MACSPWFKLKIENVYLKMSKLFSKSNNLSTRNKFVQSITIIHILFLNSPPCETLCPTKLSLLSHNNFKFWKITISNWNLIWMDLSTWTNEQTNTLHQTWNQIKIKIYNRCFTFCHLKHFTNIRFICFPHLHSPHFEFSIIFLHK